MANCVITKLAILKAPKGVELINYSHVNYPWKKKKILLHIRKTICHWNTECHYQKWQIQHYMWGEYTLPAN